MLKKDDKSQQVVYYQVSKADLVLMKQRLKPLIPVWHRDVHYSGGRVSAPVKPAQVD